MKRFILVALILLGCSKPEKKTIDTGDETSTGPNGETIVRTKFPTGQVKQEVIFKDGVKNGVARTFDKDGSVILELPYVNNKREGVSKKYYAGGVLAQSTEYKDDLMHGIQTRYRGNGNLMSEARYEFDFPCADLKEYLENKSLKKKYPAINVEIENKVKSTGIYLIRISLSERARNIKFYKGKLSATGCMFTGVEYVLKNETSNTGEISYYLPKGSFVSEELNIIATYETLMGNTMILQKKIKVAVNN
jgi:MORN repeat variant